MPFTRTVFDVAPLWPVEAIWGALPAVDIVEREGDFVIKAEMGVPANSIWVRLSQGRITIKGEKRIEASFANGVLTVTLPKTAGAAQGERKIDVKVARLDQQ